MRKSWLKAPRHDNVAAWRVRIKNHLIAFRLNEEIGGAEAVSADAKAAAKRNWMKIDREVQAASEEEGKPEATVGGFAFSRSHSREGGRGVGSQLRATSVRFATGSGEKGRVWKNCSGTIKGARSYCSNTEVNRGGKVSLSAVMPACSMRSAAEAVEISRPVGSFAWAMHVSPKTYNSWAREWGLPEDPMDMPEYCGIGDLED